SRAMELMRAKRFRHLPVMEQSAVAGIVSERDILMAIGRGTIDDAPVREVMTEHPFTLRPDQPVSEAAEIMVDAKVGALLVTTEEGKLVGLVSLPDLFGVCLESLANI
ncbi:MAG: CBS domain-containing protein, partial [Synechococcaceae cyanobacterium]|nr:CBS domain-containing protein [Synechococcaceae cyanobacterium]